MKPVAVIILNWNGAALLRRYLPSVVANTNPDIADVIVADNGSTDNSLEVLASEFPGVEVIRFTKTTVSPKAITEPSPLPPGNTPCCSTPT